jgi:putative DNA primase/helicase
MDRAIVLQLRRKLPSESVEALRRTNPDIFYLLARKLARFGADYAEQVAQARPETPQSLNDRAADNWEPLFAIADIAGGEWPEQARRAAVKISGEEASSPSINEELLSTIRDIFSRHTDGKIWLASLHETLVSDPEAPWATWNKGRPMSVRQLSNRLKEFDVFPQSVKIKGKNNKGFRAEQFEDAFMRYLTVASDTVSSDIPLSSVTQLQSNKSNQLGVTEGYTSGNIVRSQLPPKSLKYRDSNQVTDEVGMVANIQADNEWEFL